jgi:hypothetical protein
VPMLVAQILPAKACPVLPVALPVFLLLLPVRRAAVRLPSQTCGDLLLQTLPFSQPFIPHSY